MIDFDYSILACPVTGEKLIPLEQGKINDILKTHGHTLIDNPDSITDGFINESKTYFYPVFEGIVLLLETYGLFVGSGTDKRGKMAFDKQRVFKYYNEIGYKTRNNLKIYGDSAKWVDFRDVSADYIRNSFTRAKQYMNPTGKYMLDIASGPIGLPEYMSISDNYEYRICADISVNALLEAKQNYAHRKGIYLCADIVNIPLQPNVCDAVLCQHTLYHIPKNEQEKAVNEMYRVAKPSSKIAIIYSWFYNSWFMNLTLLPVQLYRIVRHLAGKVYVRLFNSKPRLYFYPHSRGWFKRKFTFSKQITFYSWRSTNKFFMNIYIHKFLGGKKILKALQRSEEKHPKFWGRFGEHPVIVIEKH